jgi:hypothetical protein
MTSAHEISPLGAPVKPGTHVEGSATQSARMKKSSLHRAVMEKLEVLRAMDDLAGGCGVRSER